MFRRSCYSYLNNVEISDVLVSWSYQPDASRKRDQRPWERTISLVERTEKSVVVIKVTLPRREYGISGGFRGGVYGSVITDPEDVHLTSPCVRK